MVWQVKTQSHLKMPSFCRPSAVLLPLFCSGNGWEWGELGFDEFLEIKGLSR